MCEIVATLSYAGEQEVRIAHYKKLSDDSLTGAGSPFASYDTPNILLVHKIQKHKVQIVLYIGYNKKHTYIKKQRQERNEGKTHTRVQSM